MFIEVFMSIKLHFLVGLIWKRSWICIFKNEKCW